MSSQSPALNIRLYAEQIEMLRRLSAAYGDESRAMQAAIRELFRKHQSMVAWAFVKVDLLSEHLKRPECGFCNNPIPGDAYVALRWDGTTYGPVCEFCARQAAMGELSSALRL